MNRLRKDRVNYKNIANNLKNRDFKNVYTTLSAWV